MLTLNRPLVFFDLESTGLDTAKDRIVQASFYKLHELHQPLTPKVQMLTVLVNPLIPIPAKSTAVHGITDQMVENELPFAAIAEDLYQFLYGCDVAGFGCNHFDVPLLFTEFNRAGLFWEPGSFHTIDVGNIFKIHESRSLAAARKFYCGKAHDQAHQADMDVLVTLEVFLAQLKRYELPTTVEELAVHSNHGKRTADLSGKFVYDENGVLLFNFGPHRGEPALEYHDYLMWMLYKANFPRDTNNLLLEILHLNQLKELVDDDDLNF